jgi:hypothetical protein
LRRSVAVFVVLTGEGTIVVGSRLEASWMELQGAAYLFNLSVLSITYSAVSVLVMLVRQSWGGRLSNFDIHLLVSYISAGFTVSVASILPTLVDFFSSDAPTTWRISSALAAALTGLTLVVLIRRRSRVAQGLPPPMVLVDFGLHSLVVLLLVINAAVAWLTGPKLFCLALTLSLIVAMWSFTRRIASLLGENPTDDWDPKRG